VRREFDMVLIGIGEEFGYGLWWIRGSKENMLIKRLICTL
jgi:hypothetical protein